MTEQTSQEIAVVDPVKELVAQVRSDVFVDQVALALPPNVDAKRFARIAVTAIQATPELALCTRESVAQALLRCAADGLLPDGREAAITKFHNSKENVDEAQYMPMIGGFRKIAADHGWALRTTVVYANDEFEYTDEPPSIMHRSVRPGMERGELAYAYAVATHKDGRRMQVVLHPDDVAKRKAVAKTKKVWEQWPAAMWEKSAGRDLFGQLPLTDHELVDRVMAAMAASDPAYAAEQLYGPESVTEHVDLETGEITAGVASPTDTASTPDGAASSGGSQQAAAAVSSAAVAVPGDDDEPEPGPATTQADELAEAARVAGTAEAVGNYKSMTIQQVHMLGEEGAEWFSYVLRHPAKYDDAFYAAVETFVQGLLPELYAVHVEWLAAREAA